MQGEYEKGIKHIQISLLQLIKLHWHSNVKYAYHIEMLSRAMFSENSNTSAPTAECYPS